MYEWKDPRGRARAASVLLWGWLAVQPPMAVYNGMVASAFGAADPSTPSGFSDPVPGMASTEAAAAPFMLGMLLLQIVTMVLVAMWIHRTNRNAWASDAGMTVSPGWAVGWFFVPFANLWKPFTGVNETWQASHLADEPWSAPMLLRWWWGLWLLTNAMANTSFRISLGSVTYATRSTLAWVDVAQTMLEMPLTLILLRIIAQLTAAQMRNLAPGIAAVNAASDTLPPRPAL